MSNQLPLLTILFTWINSKGVPGRQMLCGFVAIFCISIVAVFGLPTSSVMAQSNDVVQRLLSNKPIEAKSLGKALNQFRRNLERKESPAQLEKLLEQLKKVPSPSIGPNKTHHFSIVKNQLASFRMILDDHLAQTLPPEELPKHPSANLYPGEVPKKAKRQKQKREVNTRALGWVSTGLYAPAGEVVTVSIPQKLANKGYQIRIGVQDAILNPENHKVLRRFPRIIRHYDLDQPKTKVANAFGGLIYVRLPDPPELKGKLLINKADVYGILEGYQPPSPEYESFEFAGVVEAPRYVHGKTSAAEWRQKQRKNPAPWAEFESDKIVFAVPSNFIRNFDAPDAMMDGWDKVLDSMASLCGRPTSARAMPIHVAFDAHIAYGLAYCARWIYVPDQWQTKILQVEPAWGPLHELGHAHQHPTWTYQGGSEVTVNLFTLYALEKIHGVTTERRGPEWVGKHALPWLQRPVEKRSWTGKENGGAFWEKLSFYQVLIEEIGWEPFQKIFLDYRKLPLEQHPKSQPDRGGEFMLRLSRITERNMAPYFAAYGVQMSEKYVAEAEKLNFEPFKSRYLEKIARQSSK